MRKAPFLTVIMVMLASACSSGAHPGAHKTSASHEARIAPIVVRGAPARPTGPFRTAPVTVIRPTKITFSGSTDDYNTLWAGYKVQLSATPLDLLNLPEGAIDSALYGLGVTTYNYVQSYFQVPYLNDGWCSANPRAQAGFWVGLGDGSNQTSAFAGTPYGSVEQTGVVASCSAYDRNLKEPTGKGGPHYYGFWETYCSAPPAGANCGLNVLSFQQAFQVEPGDVVFASVKAPQSSTQGYSFTLIDMTQHKFSLTQSGSGKSEPCPEICADLTAEVVAEQPQGFNYAPYGLASFWGSWINDTNGDIGPFDLPGGARVSPWDIYREVQMEAASPSLLHYLDKTIAEPSSLSIDPNGDSGERFWVYQKDNPVTPPTPQPPAPTSPRSPSPSGPAGPATAFVTDNNANEITPINLSTGTAGPPISVPGGPSGIAVTPDGKTAYVTATNNNTVVSVDLSTGTLGTPISVPDLGVSIAITPDGKTAYVTAGLGGGITPIDLITQTVGQPISVPNSVGAVAVTPDGKTAYVADVGGTVTPVDLATGTAGTPISVPGGPSGIAFTPDGKTAYVADTSSDSVTPIDLATGTVGSSITIPMGVQGGIAITPNGKTVYVTSGYGSILPITLANSARGTAINVPFGDGAGLAIAPHTNLSTATTPSTGPSLVVLSGGQPVVRPKKFWFTGDSTGYIDGLKWSSWNAAGAKGIGTLHLNDCTPNCASGTFHAYPATVGLSGASHTQVGYIFTKLSIDSPTAPGGSQSFSIPR